MTRATIYLERTIDSSHVIPGHPGKCGRLHGHTYRFEVWVTGPINDETGMVVDFYDVKSLIDEWDHQHLNDMVEFIPTAENLAAEMRQRILQRLRGTGGSFTCRLRLWETPAAYAEVDGELPADEASAAVPGVLGHGVNPL